MKPAALLAAALFLLSAAWAGEAPVDVSGKVRLRGETVEDRAVPDDGHLVSVAATLRAVWEPTGSLSLVGSGELIGELTGRFDDGEGAPTGRGVIPDPSGFSLQEAFLEYRGGEALRSRLGRQEIAYDDERFIGAIAFRQNAQSFDAARLSVSGVHGLAIDVAQVFGVDRPLGPRGQPQRLESESLLIRAEVPAPFGSFTGYRYALDLGEDQEASPVQGGRSLTYGGLLRSRIRVGNVSLGFLGELAQQENDETGETVPFGRSHVSATFDRFQASVQYERLGAGTQAFQTPLGTNHAFQGHADLFLVTPADGLADLSIGGLYKVGDLGPFKRVTVAMRAHQFDPTAAGSRYGREVDVTLATRWRRLKLSAERAGYEADGFAEDVTRWWFTAETQF